MTKRFQIIRGTVGAEEAADKIDALLKTGKASIEAEVYYPYFSFAGQCHLPTLFGRHPVEVSCLVNAVTGHGSTADGFTIDPLNVPDQKVIPAELSAVQAKKSAQRTLTFTLGRKLRVISTFDIELEANGLVYKRFWVVGSSYHRAMVDSVTGCVHPLRERAGQAVCTTGG